MGAIITLVVLAVIVIAVLGASIKVVQQQNTAIIERFGKYIKTLQPGIHLIIPFVDSVAAVVPLRVQQDVITIETKTLDNVFCVSNVAVQYRVDEKSVEDSYYKLQSPVDQIKSYVQDAIRSAIPNMTLDDAFAKKEDIASDVLKTVSKGMDGYGFVIVSTLITDISPADEVKNAMNEINVAQRKRVAAQELANADKIKLVTNAQAEAEASRLDGKGIADQRREIANGLAEQMKTLREGGVDDTQVMALLLTTQYMNMMEAMGTAGGANVIFQPTGPDAAAELQQKIISAISAGSKLTSEPNQPEDLTVNASSAAKPRRTRRTANTAK